jgi:hypothetical protein
LKKTVTEVLAPDLLEELGADRLIAGLAEHGRLSSKNPMVRFEPNSVLNFPSQTDLPLIYYDAEDKHRINELVAEELLHDVTAVVTR